MIHQTVSLGKYWKLFSATLNYNFESNWLIELSDNNLANEFV